MSEEEIEAFFSKKGEIRETEKKKYGEVFTPVNMVHALLDRLPPKVWKSPEFIWCEPACGIGHISAFIYLRLMNGLSSVIPDRAKRHRHVLSQIIMCEINAENARQLRRFFGPSARVIEGDFLSWKGDNVDIVVGNPPFNGGGSHIRSVSTSGCDNGLCPLSGGRQAFGQSPNALSSADRDVRSDSGGKGGKIYDRFIERAIDLGAKWVSMIVPDVVFSGNGSPSYRRMISKGHVVSVDFTGNFQGVQQWTCQFLWTSVVGRDPQKSLVNNTLSVFLKDRVANPFRHWTKRTEMLVNRHVGETRNVAVYVRGRPLSEYSRVPKGRSYCLIYGDKERGGKLYTEKRELAVGLGVPKIVLMMMSPDLKMVVDRTGKCGCGPNTLYVPWSRWRERFFFGAEYRELMLACRASRQFLNARLVEHLRLGDDGRVTRRRRRGLRTKNTRKK